MDFVLRTNTVLLYCTDIVIIGCLLSAIGIVIIDCILSPIDIVITAYCLLQT